MTHFDFAGTERLQIRRRLGEGGFGVVYEAFDKKREIAVAVKTLKTQDFNALYRFKQEFRTLADTHHRNLVMLYELATEGDLWFFTMELVDGVSFRRYVRPDLTESPAGGRSDAPTPPAGDSITKMSSATTVRTQEAFYSSTLASPDDKAPRRPLAHAAATGPVDLEVLRSAFSQLADGVMALHRSDIIHRDLKPSNVLVGRDGRVVVLDFGLASGFGLNNLVESGEIVGTPPFMAPEQMTGSSISESSDWFSIGVMLYEALTGRLPFQGTLQEIYRAKNARTAPSPRELVNTTPRELSDLCWSLLSPDPADRASGGEVLEVLSGRGRSVIIAAPPSQRRAPLIGRRRQMDQFQQAYASARRGEAVVVGVHGRSGMGKTALVRSFLRKLSEEDPEMLLLTGRCYEREAVPYKAFDGIIDALAQKLERWPVEDLQRVLPRELPVLTRIFPALSELAAAIPNSAKSPDIPDAKELRRRAFAVFRQLFTQLAQKSTIVTFIDDLHWGDMDSAALLQDGLQLPNGSRMFLVVCYRTDEKESSPVLRELLPAWKGPDSPVHFVEIEVGELDPEHACELARDLFARYNPDAVDLAEAIARESGGSPFFLDELARHAASSGRGELSAGSLDDLIRARVGELPDDSRRLLEFIAVAGQPLELQVAQRAAGLDAEEHPAYEFLRAARLVRSRETGESKQVETYHDRIRETVVGAFDSGVLKTSHLRLAQTWEATGRFDPEALAEHFELGGEEPRAAGYAAQAADQAVRALAFDRGARLYRKALQLRTYDKPQENALRVALADALANGGRGADAAEQYLMAAEDADRSRGVELRRRAAQGLLFTGHIEEGLSALQQVLRLVNLKLAPNARRAFLNLVVNRLRLALNGFRYRERSAAEISERELQRIDTCWSAAYALGMTDVIRGADFQVKHILLALRAGEPYRISRAMALEIGFAGGRGARAEQRAELFKKRAMELAERVGNPHALALVTLQIGAHENLSGHVRKCSEYFERAEQILRERCTGVAWELDVAQLFWLHTQLYLGNWQAMAERMNIILKEAHERGDLYIATYIRSRVLFIARLVEDQADAAWDEQQSALDSWLLKGFHVQHYWNWVAQCEIDLYANRPKRAYDRIVQRWPEFRRSLIPQISTFRCEAAFLRARAAIAYAKEDRRSSSRLLQEARRIGRRLEKENVLWSRAQGFAVRAATEAASGNKKAAVQYIRAAQESFQAAGLMHMVAASQRRRGELVGGAGGERLIHDSEIWMKSQRVRNSAALATMLAPGDWT